jgi:hypothetical protein
MHTNIHISVSVILWLSLNLGVYCSLKKLDVLRGLQHKKKSRAIPVACRRGPQGCETSRLPHFLLRQSATDSDDVILTRWSPFIARKILDIHFWGWVNPKDIVRVGSFRSIKKIHWSRDITAINFRQDFIEYPSLKVKSINRLNYWGSSMRVST